MRLFKICWATPLMWIYTVYPLFMFQIFSDEMELMVKYDLILCILYRIQMMTCSVAGYAKNPFSGIKINMILSIVLAVVSYPVDKVFALAALCSVTDAVYYYLETFVITSKSDVYNKFIIVYEVLFILFVAAAVIPKNYGDLNRFIVLTSCVNVIVVCFAYKELIQGFKQDTIKSSILVYNSIKFKLMQKHLKSLISEVINFIGYTTHKSVGYIKYEKVYRPLETLLKVESVVVLGENEIKEESLKELRVTSYVTTAVGIVLGLFWAREIVVQRVITHIALSIGYVKQLKADFAGKEKTVTLRVVSLTLVQLVVMMIIDKPEYAIWVITVFAIIKTLSIPNVKNYMDLRIDRK